MRCLRTPRGASRSSGGGGRFTKPPHPRGGGDPIYRFAGARVLAPADIGTLQVQIHQWANTPLKDAGNLRIRVYPWGARLRPVAEAEADPNPSFDLPAGEYDVVWSLNDEVRRFDGVRVEPGATESQRPHPQ